MLSKPLIRETEVDNGRRIRVYDNIFDMEYRNRVYRFAQESSFRIGWTDSTTVENKKYQSLHSA